MSLDTPWIKFLIYFHFLSHPLFQTTSNQLGHMKSLYCDIILFNGWGILWRGVICLRNKVFAAYQFIVSPVDLPKLGPCPLTGVACSLVNKGLVLWDLCCVYTTIHSQSLVSARDWNRGSVYLSKPVGRLLPISDGFKPRCTLLINSLEFKDFFYLASLRSTRDQNFDRSNYLFSQD